MHCLLPVLGAATSTGLFSHLQPGALLATLVYTIIGFVLFVASYFLFEKFAPFPVRKELVEDDNVAVGVIIAGMMIGMAIILAAAISG